MSREDLFQTVSEVCAQILGVPRESVTPEASLREDLEADSLDFAELVMALEDRTGVTIPEGQFKTVRTVSDALDLIEQHLAPAAS
jgi:acyl carrier protein